jgi:hypothetical protein
MIDVEQSKDLAWLNNNQGAKGKSERELLFPSFLFFGTRYFIIIGINRLSQDNTKLDVKVCSNLIFAST